MDSEYTTLKLTSHKNDLPLNVVVVDRHTDDELRKFVSDQLSRWEFARDNYRALKKVDIREMEYNGLRIAVHCNPSRAISSKAKTDSASLNARPCFLCRSNRPAEQISLDFEGTKDKKYHILTNPFPVFQNHLIVAADSHIPQSIWHRYVDMLILAKRYRQFTWIYNGPKCGASAPDHLHFQAFPSGILPLENDIRKHSSLEYVTCVQDASLYRYGKFANGIFVIDGITSKSVAKMLYRLLDCVPVEEGDSEPRFNLFTFYADGHYVSIVVLRTCHRSSHYSSTDPVSHLSMSPGCVDVGGVFITVEHDDYEKLTPGLLAGMMEQVTIGKDTEDLIVRRLTRTQPSVEVDVFSARELIFEITSDGAGRRAARYQDGRIEYGGILYDELFFEAKTLSTMYAETSFILQDVPYAGSLRITVSDGVLVATNIIGVEDFILSILSSEGPSQYDGVENLMERAMALRSGLMASKPSAKHQGYSGLTAVVSRDVREAVDRTWGEY